MEVFFILNNFQYFIEFSKITKNLKFSQKQKILKNRYPTHFWISLLVEELDVFPF